MVDSRITPSPMLPAPSLNAGLQPRIQLNAPLQPWPSMDQANFAARPNGNADLDGIAAKIQELDSRLHSLEGQIAAPGMQAGANPLQPEDIAETVRWVVSLLPHVNINSVEIMPVSQSWAPFKIHRDTPA